MLKFAVTLGLTGILLNGLLHSCTHQTSRATPKPIAPTQVYPVRSDILAIEINTQQVIRAQQQPYQKQLGDRIEQPRPKRHDWVKNPIGQARGSLVGKDRSIFYGFDQLQGQRLNLDLWRKPEAIKITSKDDPAYAKPQVAKALYRKSKPREVAEIGAWKVDWAEAHQFYLQLPQPLSAGKTYTLSFRDAVAPVEFTHRPAQQRSEAVQVSQLGFRSEDPVKIAFLSSWMGDGGGVKYQEGMKFWLMDANRQDANPQAVNPKPVFQGKTQISRRQTEPEDGRNRNYNQSDVYALDFSEFRQAGKYRVCVESIGCSFVFEIGAKVWDNPFYTSIRGLYHQRAGIAIGAPYSTYKRPRAFHNDDGVNIFQAKARLSDNGEGFYGLPSYQDRLPPTKTKETLQNAWGGYFDAGDWDRRVQHVEVSRSLIELAEMFPNYMEAANLNIPESTNKLPDIIDEALWNLDFFRRLQTPDGGIRGGIQSASYSRAGEASWQESLDVLAYAPDPWATYSYAAGAAQAAQWLKTREPKLAQTYRDSAIRAMDYAEAAITTPQETTLKHFQLRDARNLAALSMWRLLASENLASDNLASDNLASDNPKSAPAQRWQRIFVETSVFTDPTQPIYAWDSHDQKDAAFLYLRLPQNLRDPKLYNSILNALKRDADRAVKNTESSGYKWAKDDDQAPIGYGNSWGSPKTISLLRAHYLTQDEKYLKAALLASQFSIGANPLNLSYTTGLGQRSPQHPLIIDQRITNQAPPPGITLYGPIDPIEFNKEWYLDSFKPILYPAFEKWPATEAYFDIYVAPAMNEFTVMQTIGPSIYTWGYFAARKV